MDDASFTRKANDAIEQGLRDGMFDNLPGKGKPFNWEEWDNPYIKAEERTVQIILKNAGFMPGWIAERREIEEIAAGARTSLARSWQWVQQHGGLSDAAAAQQWALAVGMFRKAVSDLNRRIRDLNLLQPVQLPALPLLDAEREIAQVRAVKHTSHSLFGSHHDNAD